MKAIFKKELNSFFSSAEGYLIVAVFLVLNGLFLWVFKTNYNIFDSGLADLNTFFQLLPWIFMFLIPAISMKRFSEEKRSGALELLLTKPLPLRHIISGKFLAVFIVVLIALLPTLLYVLTLTKLRIDEHVIDYGSIVASYSGLLFLTGTYVAIGIFSSAITRHQLIAFITAVSICFFMYYGFEAMARLPVFNTLGFSIADWGIKAHFNSMTRGVLDTTDIVYFLSVSLFFMFLTQLHLKYSLR